MKRARARLIREATEWRCEWRRARPYVNRTGPSAREPLSLSLSFRADHEKRGREASMLKKEKERRKKKPAAAAAAARAGCQLQKQCRHRHRRDKHAFIPESVVCARRRGRMRYSPGSPRSNSACARALWPLSVHRFRSFTRLFPLSFLPLYIYIYIFFLEYSCSEEERERERE